MLACTESCMHAYMILGHVCACCTYI